ncbi:MAG: hypothetical protein ACO4AM_05505 [Candidatus Nanopelagicaceae bacterium]
MRYSILILAFMATSCDLLSTDAEREYYASFYITDAEWPHKQIVLVSSDIDFGDRLIRKDDLPEGYKPQMVYDGKVRLEGDMAVEVTFYEQGYRKYEMVYHYVEQIEIVEWVGSYVVASANGYREKTYAMGDWVSYMMQIRQDLSNTNVMQVVVDKSQDVETIEALI